MLHSPLLTCTLLGLVAASAANSPSLCSPPSTDPAQFAQREFDYVVIGGGVGGLTVASRLAEDPNLQIAVIEAGFFHPSEPLINIPQNIGLLEGNQTFDWSFLSVPQAGLNGLQMPVPRGKMLGGSSGLNFLAWNRAPKTEYDSWTSFASGFNWDFEGLLPYFKRSTAVRSNQSNPFPGIAPGLHEAGFNPEFVGFNGPIEASYNDIYVDPVFPFVETLNALNIPTNPNPDSGKSTGVINTRSSIDRSLGVRSYATQYYCRSVRRNNFHVLTGAQVTQISLQPDAHTRGTFTASGVNFVVNSTQYFVKARKEVILSAGAIQTPQLLELSGVGNSTLLKSLNVTTLIDLPGVGENLQDHITTGVQYQLKPGVRDFDELRINASFKAQQTAIYDSTGGGFLAAIDPTMAYLPFQLYLNATQTKEMIDLLDRTTPKDGTLQPLQYQIQRRWIESGQVPQVELILFDNGQLPPLQNVSYITVLCAMLHPLARGFVHINTTDPLVHPVIDQQYYTNDYDVQTALGALKLLLRLQDSTPLSTLIQNRTAPPPQMQSDEDLIAYLRTVAESASHPSGTAAMAPREHGGVVDSDLKVYGTSNLRVIDASVIPMITGAHLQATTYAIAEKAADIIKSKA